MTQEDKNLLLTDLCARLPYEIILFSSNEKITYQTDGNTAAELLVEEGWKPYLRPMSSMTEEEREEFREIGGVMSYNPQNDHYAISAFTPEAYDWLNSHHFDYRGLIERGLALDAPGGMYN